MVGVKLIPGVSQKKTLKVDKNKLNQFF